MYGEHAFVPSVVDQIKQLGLNSQRAGQAAAPPAAPLPVEIQLADKFIERYQAFSVPHACGSRGDQVMRRDVGADELMALGSACDLLRDYFDRHNQGLQAQRAAAKAIDAMAGMIPQPVATTG